ncbi:MAG: YabP/YqfC family sporulation protein [Acetobacter sp.]|nr:YabP/YqfC family sporulation protein [Bacteroides sp.]MCM1340873.1 YabP/YqfC family sporulation protein [Acetobacter sp.]MCM1432570.1 YabP/YqfC family sporulation protein [Clostridiales bacterium]
MKKKSIKDKLSNNSKELLFGMPRIEIAGNECTVDGLQSIIEYSGTKITVSLGSQIITFYGDELKINSFTRDGAVVEGNILSMEFSE